MPEATSAHGDQPVFLRFSALENKTTITIDVPASKTTTPLILNLAANTSRSLDMTKFLSLLECKVANKAVNNGLRIRSTDFISVYYEIANYWNTDIFTLKGKNALGKHFLTPFQSAYGIGTYNPDAYSSIDIVATEDNTIVTINPTENLTGTKLQTVTVKLNRGQTYSVTAAGKAGSQHLTGTVIKSSKPIAVTMKDDSVYGNPCLDMVGDQLVPVDLIGSEYIVMKGRLNIDEYFIVLASENGTSVEISGPSGKSTRNLNTGGSVQWKMSSSTYYVKSNKPVYLFHLSGFGCEFGGALIPPLECSGAKEVSFVRSSSESLFLNIVAKNGDEDEFEFNGSTGLIKASDFQTVPGTSNWKSVQLEVKTSDLRTGTLGKVINKKSRFQLGVINGGVSSGTKYGYFSPFSSLNLGDTLTLCRGKNAVLDAGYGFDTVLWSTNSNKPQITVNKEGRYTVRAATTNGCVLYDTVTVIKSKKPGIAVNDSTQCLVGNGFRFEAEDFKSTTTYTWSLENAINQGKNFSYFFSKATRARVLLEVKDDNGCRDSIAMDLETYANPEAKFTTSKSIACEAQALAFTEGASTSSGFSFNWQFGDGGSSALANPEHTYLKQGRYKVFFEATSPNNCPDTLSRFIQVSQKPEALFSWKANSLCEQENVTSFSNQSTSDVGFSSIWDFGDGTKDITSSPEHGYKAGRYQIALLIQNSRGCLDTFFDSITVFPSPQVDFGINDDKQCADVNEFVFRQNSSIGSGTLIAHNWILGDGSTAVGDSVTKSYINKFDFINVSLISTSNENCSDTLTQQIEIDPVPDAKFRINQSAACLSGNQFRFTDLSTVLNANLKYKWDFGDNGSSNSQNPAHQYKTADTFQVQLVAYDDCFDTASLSVVVHPQPQSGFAVNDTVQCFDQNRFRFNNTSSISSGGLRHNWYFDNGVTDNSTHPKIKFAQTGFYKVRLRSISDQNCLDSHYVYVHVRPEPRSDFAINDSTQCFNPQLFQFVSTAKLDSGYLTMLWDFGDSKGSFGKSPKHKYADTGTYNVIHTAITYSGCVDSAIIPVSVYPSPVSAFNINDTDQCINVNQFLLSNKSSISKGSLRSEWHMGDGALLYDTNPVYSYSKGDTFWIQLSTTSNLGCTEKDSSQVVVWEKPLIRFYLNDTQQCLENNYLISYNTSQSFQDRILYTWNLGDGTLSLDEAPEHEYQKAGVFKVWLTGITNTGCRDSFSRNVTVHPQPAPNAGFSLESDSAQCLAGNQFELRNLSSISQGNLKLIWKPDDGRVIEDSTLTLNYGYADTFSFRLIAESSYGCKDSMERTLYVWPQTDLKLGYSYPLCEADSFDLYNQSSIKWGSSTFQLLPGNGKVYTGDARHIIPEWGVYTAFIRSESNYGCLDSLTDTFFVNPKALVKFELDRHYNQTISLRNESTIPRGTFNWRIAWGDLAKDSNNIFIHRYEKKGNYSVKLRTLSDSGCLSSAILPVEIGKNYPTLEVVSRYVDTSKKGMLVSWLPDDRAASYTLLRRDPNTVSFISLGTGLTSLNYDDWNAETDTLIYEYAIVGKDSLLQYSDTSLIGRNMVLYDVAHTNTRKATLQWTAYGDHWLRTDSHLVYRYLETGPELVGYSRNSQLQYSDSAEQLLPGHCYRVVAVGPEGAKSYSNVLCNGFLFFVPNAFSPNGDGLNDVFSYVINGLHDFELSIYARNGQRVFHTLDPHVFWDGNMHGIMATTDMYRWIIKGKKENQGTLEEQVFTGQVYLLR